MARLTLGLLAAVGALAGGCGVLGDFVIPDDDRDGDGVADAVDVDPDLQWLCDDSDLDGCDDCSVHGAPRPEDDGWDYDADGTCDARFDVDCLHGAHADTDAGRREACVMLALANQDRAWFASEAEGAQPLRWNEDLWGIADAHAQDMCTRGYFSHNTPEGLDPGGRALRAGIAFDPSENISANFDAAAAHYGLMLEPTCVGHRRNLLDPSSVEVGIGYVHCDNDSSQLGHNHHAVQDFRVDFTRDSSPFCESPATHREVPPNPPTTAVCPEDLRNWCEPPSASLLGEWDCPAD